MSCLPPSYRISRASWDARIHQPPPSSSRPSIAPPVSSSQAGRSSPSPDERRTNHDVVVPPAIASCRDMGLLSGTEKTTAVSRLGRPSEASENPMSHVTSYGLDCRRRQSGRAPPFPGVPSIRIDGARCDARRGEVSDDHRSWFCSCWSWGKTKPLAGGAAVGDPLEAGRRTGQEDGDGGRGRVPRIH